MNESLTDNFDLAVERYKAGEEAETLIPVFQEICANSPKNAASWSCLAWLYLLTDQSSLALKAAQKSVKLDSGQPQARVNLVLAMLDAGQPGVRQQIQVVQQLIAFDSQILSDIEENIVDGLKRKPDWESLKKIKNWLKVTG